MSTDLPPLRALEKLFEGFRRGFAAKDKSVQSFQKIIRRASPEELSQIRHALTRRYQTCEMTSNNLGSYVANEAALTLMCMGELVEIPTLVEIACSRLSENQQVNKVWADEIAPEIHWVLMNHPEKLDAAAEQSIKAYATMIKAQEYVLGADAARAVQTWVNNADWVIFERFQRDLEAQDAGAAGAESAAAKADPVRDFSPVIADALEKAAEHLTGHGQFDSKTGADLIRTSIDETHREIVNHLISVYGGAPDHDKDGARRAYMRQCGFITPPEEKFFSAIYSLVSEEASHKLLAERETALFMHVTVSHYIRLLVERLSRRITP
jgi:hypothetical protein